MPRFLLNPVEGVKNKSKGAARESPAGSPQFVKLRVATIHLSSLVASPPKAATDELSDPSAQKSDEAVPEAMCVPNRPMCHKVLFCSDLWQLHCLSNPSSKLPACQDWNSRTSVACQKRPQRAGARCSGRGRRRRDLKPKKNRERKQFRTR